MCDMSQCKMVILQRRHDFYIPFHMACHSAEHTFCTPLELSIRVVTFATPHLPQTALVPQGRLLQSTAHPWISPAMTGLTHTPFPLFTSAVRHEQHHFTSFLLFFISYCDLALQLSSTTTLTWNRKTEEMCKLVPCFGQAGPKASPEGEDQGMQPLWHASDAKLLKRLA